MMHNTCVLYPLILLYLCYGSLGFNIYLEIKRNGTSETFEESQTIEYNERDVDSATVDLICKITINTYTNGKPPRILWIEDGVEWEPKPNGINIMTRKILKAEDDGKELKCKAESQNKKTWTISAHFKKKKTAKEIMLAKPNVFKIVLIAIAATIAGAIVLLVCYGAMKYLWNRKRDEEDCSDDPSRAETVSYCTQLNLAEKKEPMIKNQTNHDSHTEIGIENIGCQIQENGGYVKFPHPDSDHIQMSDNIMFVSSRIENLENHIRKSNGKISDENKMSLEKIESSSEC